MKMLVESRCVAKCQYGVKILGGGSEKFKALNKPITIEVADATTEAIETIKSLGG
jgi:ribosomal protein L15